MHRRAVACCCRRCCYCNRPERGRAERSSKFRAVAWSAPNERFGVEGLDSHYSEMARSPGLAGLPAEALASAKLVEIIVLPFHATLAGKSTAGPAATTAIPPPFEIRTTLFWRLTR